MSVPTPVPAPIDCETAVRRLWDYLDAELDAERAAEVRAHLGTCSACPGHFVFARTFLAALADARREHDAPDALRGRVVASLRARGFAPRRG